MKTIHFLLLLSAMLSFSVRNSDIRGQEGHQLPACLSAEEDHQNMMDQLGITELRPGKNADPAAPNPANYDESKANPFPDLPDLLTTKDGKKVTTPEMWWKQRRPEIAEDFAREVYGRVPENTPEVTWEVVLSEREFIGWTPVIARKVTGHVDNSEYPLIDVDISMVVVTLAFEQRFAFGLIGSPGKGGATLHRRNYGEAVENLTGGEYYWMA